MRNFALVTARTLAVLHRISFTSWSNSTQNRQCLVSKDFRLLSSSTSGAFFRIPCRKIWFDFIVTGSYILTYSWNLLTAVSINEWPSITLKLNCFDAVKVRFSVVDRIQIWISEVPSTWILWLYDISMFAMFLEILMIYCSLGDRNLGFLVEGSALYEVPEECEPKLIPKTDSIVEFIALLV